MFKALYGVDSKTMTDAWEYLKIMEMVPHKGTPMHLLWLCYWWKGYSINDACAANLGTNHVTFHDWVEKFERAIAELPIVSEPVNTTCEHRTHTHTQLSIMIAKHTQF